MSKKFLRYSDLSAEQLNFFLTYVYKQVRIREFPIDVAGFTFDEPNKIHDFEYWRGGRPIDRLRADVKFLCACISETFRLVKPQYWFYFLVGIVGFYFAIRSFGRFSFAYSECPAHTWNEFLGRCGYICEESKH